MTLPSEALSVVILQSVDTHVHGELSEPCGSLFVNYLHPLHTMALRKGFRIFSCVLFAFCCGIVIGILSTLLILYPKSAQKFDRNNTSHTGEGKVIQENQSIVFQDSKYHHDNTNIAEDLKRRIRVLCWVMTSPQNLHVKTIHIKHTWAKRCNVVLYISSTTDKSFPTVGLNVSEGRQHLTEKTMQAFKYIYDNHYNDADWFMKADDDTYVILENLRYFLTSQSPKDPVYFGHHFGRYLKQGYLSGGAGYVLSKEALRRLIQQGNNTKICNNVGENEDLEIGRCMENIGVKIGNSSDSLGRTRFHCFTPELHLSGDYPSWFYRFDAFHGKNKGIDGISDYAISFHYVKPNHMYDLEFYVYHLRPYGVTSGHQNLNQPAH